MILENSPFPYLGVPLNIMCSSMWERPARPMTSLREPTLYQIWTVMTGALCSSASSTMSPLASVKSWTVRRPAIACWLVGRNARSETTAARHRIRWRAVTGWSLSSCVRLEDRNRVRTARTGRGDKDRRIRHRAQLAARAQDVPPLAFADVGLQPVPCQDGLEAQHAFIGGPPVRVARKLVERDQVDLAAETAQQLDEPRGVLLRVVHVGQQHVLERQAAVWFQGKRSTGCQQGLQRVHLVDRRHE